MTVINFYPNGSQMCPRRKYRLRNFLLDLVMVVLTGGLWLIWIFCREMRNR